MTHDKLQFDHPVTVVGGGGLRPEDLKAAISLAPSVIAADGAANRLMDLGIAPAAVIGDMDSLNDPGSLPAESRIVPIAEQDTTDFEKCLYATQAPLYLGVGFTARRVDHMLAVFHGMLARPEKRVVLLGEADAIALVPPCGIRLDMRPGTRVSVFPLTPVRAVRSDGLEWPLDDLDLRVGRQVGTSNRAIAEQVEIVPDGPGLLLLVPPDYLPALARAVRDKDRSDAKARHP